MEQEKNATRYGQPTQRMTALVSNARDFQIVDSTLSVVGGDVHNHYYHSESPKDIWAVLRLIPNFRKIYQDMLSKATPGTGMWLLKGDKFRLWLEPNGDIKIFWGSGIPGAGKTLLASIVIAHLEAMCQASDAKICVCYVFFRYSEQAEVTVGNVLEVLVKQTLERHPECLALIEETYFPHLRESTEPTEAQLLGLLRELADRMTCTFYILDALDEAPTRVQLAVVKALASLNVKLFVTSRPLKTLEASFPQAQTFTIVAQDADIDLHIAKAIGESTDLQHIWREAGPALREEIVSTIKQNCGGMFLHASLQVDALQDCLSAYEVRGTLKVFPPRIEDVYRQTWARICNQTSNHALLAKAVLAWVLNASRSMTIDELERAVATSPDSYTFQADRIVPGTTLMSLCRGLVTVEEESRHVRLVHYTAEATLRGLLQQSFPRPHSLLSSVCLTHLIDCGFQNTTISVEEEFTTALKVDPLLTYASEAWASHVRESLNCPDSKRRAAKFITDSNAFPAFTNPNHSAYFDVLTPLHLLGLYHLPLNLIEDTTIGNPNVVSKIHQQSPLIVASRFGHEDVVALLLALPGIQVNMADAGGWSPLMWAARLGHNRVIAILLAYSGIQVNMANKHGWTALMLAASAGLQCTVERLLACPGIQVNAVNNDGWSALMLAARLAFVDVAVLLLDHPGIKINLVTDSRWSALMLAAKSGCEGVAKALLAYPGIQVNLVNDDGWSALMVASFYGGEGVVRLLLARDDVAINSRDSNGDTAIKLAAGKGHEAIIRMLLDICSIDTTIKSTTDGRTAISAAQANGHTSTVQLLQDFESQQAVVASLPEKCQLSLHEGVDEDGSDSDSEEADHDAEEGKEECDI